MKTNSKIFLAVMSAFLMNGLSANYFIITATEETEVEEKGINPTLRNLEDESESNEKKETLFLVSNEDEKKEGENLASLEDEKKEELFLAQNETGEEKKEDFFFSVNA